MSEARSEIGRYEIRRELGRGMMGVVYEAHDPVLGRDIALKVIQLAFSPSEEDRHSFEQRFFAEARTAARLSHPGILVVHDVGRDAGSEALFMALELLRGQTLDRALKERGPLDWREALRIVQRVAEALHHAHASGVVHRDIKPANIMLLPSGEPKIMDFGIAKIEASQLTASGQFLGTPLYMSPEQALAHPVDGRSDLFSLGSVLYEMLTGRQAFGGESVTKILFQVVSREPEPVSVVTDGLPEAVDYLLARCLAKDLTRRYPDGRTLAEDIEDVLAGRPPRGQASWQPAVQAQGTLIAPAAATPTFVPRAGVTAAATPATAPGAHPPSSTAARPAGVPTSGPAEAPSTARPKVGSSPARAPMPTRHHIPARDAGKAPRSMARSALAVGAMAGVLVAAAVIGGVLLLRSGDPTSAPPPVGRRIAPTPLPAATPPPTPPQQAEASEPRDTRPSRVPVSPVPREGQQDERSSFRRDDKRDKDEDKREEEAPAAVTPARLLIDFEHSLRSGTLSVWVDDEPVIEEEIGGRVTREIAGIKFRKGRLSDTLEVAPGRREVRVQVAWDDNVKTESAYANFKAGETFRLRAKLGGLGGLKKNLSLDWQ